MSGQGGVYGVGGGCHAKQGESGGKYSERAAKSTATGNGATGQDTLGCQHLTPKFISLYLRARNRLLVYRRVR